MFFFFLQSIILQRRWLSGGKKTSLLLHGFRTTRPLATIQASRTVWTRELHATREAPERHWGKCAGSIHRLDRTKLGPLRMLVTTIWWVVNLRSGVCSRMSF